MKIAAAPFIAGIYLASPVAMTGVHPVLAEEGTAAGAVAPTSGVGGAEAAEGEAPELTEAADLAIERELEFLIQTQKPDGSWGNDDGSFTTAGTSLGLMAFMVKGHFPGFGRHGAALDRAKEYLLKKAEDSSTGYLGGMYEHGLYTLCLSELWGMTAEKQVIF